MIVEMKHEGSSRTIERRYATKSQLDKLLGRNNTTKMHKKNYDTK